MLAILVDILAYLFKNRQLRLIASNPAKFELCIDFRPIYSSLPFSSTQSLQLTQAVAARLFFLMYTSGRAKWQCESARVRVAQGCGCDELKGGRA